MEPEVHYARNGPASIAYRDFGGDGPDLLALPSAPMLPMEAVFEEPSLARFHRRLSSFSRLIHFDPRGVGLSDPVAPADPTTLEQWVADAVAVLDATGSARATVLAATDEAMVALLLAATYPERVANLVILNGTARYPRDHDYPFGIPVALLDAFIEANFDPEGRSGGPDYFALTAPSVADDAAFRAWWIRSGRRGASPATARAIQAVFFRADLRAVLPFVRCPTLVVHRRDNALVRVGHGRYLAEHLPQARYVELDGADDLYWVGDTDLILDEIEELVTGSRGVSGTERVLTTILFVDIVGSTARLAELGDRSWAQLLERYEAALRRQLDRFAGREVKTTGDGALVVFDGPARAVTCACAIRDAAAQLGLGLRAGLHTGEVELRGSDITGLAVHVAARIQALAEPQQVLVSRTVVDLVAGSGLEFRDQGLRSLRDVPGEWRLFAC